MAIMTVAIGAELIEALGLPKGRVIDVDLHFHSNEIVTADVKLAPQRDQIEGVLSILKRYELHEKSVEVTPVEPEQTTEDLRGDAER